MVLVVVLLDRLLLLLVVMMLALVDVNFSLCGHCSSVLGCLLDKTLSGIGLWGIEAGSGVVSYWSPK